MINYSLYVLKFIQYTLYSFGGYLVEDCRILMTVVLLQTVVQVMSICRSGNFCTGLCINYCFTILVNHWRRDSFLTTPSRTASATVHMFETTRTNYGYNTIQTCTVFHEHFCLVFTR